MKFEKIAKEVAEKLCKRRTWTKYTGLREAVQKMKINEVVAVTLEDGEKIGSFNHYIYKYGGEVGHKLSCRKLTDDRIAVTRIK